MEWARLDTFSTTSENTKLARNKIVPNLRRAKAPW